MKVAVLDKDVPGLECIDRSNERFYDELMSIWTDCDIVDIYFVNVSDETFKKFAEEGDKRVSVKDDELKEYLKSFDYVLVYANKKLKLCFMKRSQANLSRAC
jgi:hypothetical protein